jgi:hypothetical protein
MKKNMILGYSAPEFEIYEVAAERGFIGSDGQGGTTIPGLTPDPDDGLEF